MNHGIPTLYRGIQYRSRIEARYAAFFSEIGWKFTYEPFDGHGYIPDFAIHGAAPLLIEVKSAVTEDEYRAPIPKITAGLNGHWNHDILILGADPLPGCLDTGFFRDDAHPAAGLLGERYETVSGGWTLDGVRIGDDVWEQLKRSTGELWRHVKVDEIPESGWHYAAGDWFRCELCDAICVYHHVHSYRGRPCGHYNGTHYLGDIDPAVIEDAWAEACNEVKWYGTDVS